MKELNVFIAGVGGQGVILISELLGEAAASDNLSVRGSELLGMAVRGGSVTSKVRLGSNIYGPLIPAGKGDLMIAMEPLEALRNITYMSRSSLILLSTQTIMPVSVLLGKNPYPGIEEIIDKLINYSDRVVVLDAVKLAQKAGSILSANIVMLGAAFGTGLIPIQEETIKETIKLRFPARVIPINITAFGLGYQACQQKLKELMLPQD